MHFSLQRARQPPTVILSVACDESWSPHGRARILEQFKDQQTKNQSRKPHLHTMLREIAAAAPPGLLLPHIFTSRDQFCQPIQLMHFPVGCCTKHRFPALLVATTAFHRFFWCSTSRFWWPPPFWRQQLPFITWLFFQGCKCPTSRLWWPQLPFPKVASANIPFLMATIAI